jgi:hypothetical protein
VSGTLLAVGVAAECACGTKYLTTFDHRDRACRQCCIKAGAPTVSARPRATGRGWDRSRPISRSARRLAILTRDGYRCTYTDPDTGERCAVVDSRKLSAARTDPADPDPATGRTLCNHLAHDHRRHVERYATTQPKATT